MTDVELKMKPHIATDGFQLLNVQQNINGSKLPQTIGVKFCNITVYF